MNKTISIFRILIILALSSFAFLFLLGEEQDENLLAFVFRFLADKALAIGAIFLIVRLYKRWCKVDPWFIAYEKMCDEVMEKPNPMYLGKDNED